MRKSKAFLMEVDMKTFITDKTMQSSLNDVIVCEED